MDLLLHTNHITSCGQWAVELLLFTAALPCGSGQRISCCFLPHFLRAAGNESRAEQCHTGWGQWAAGILLPTAALPWGSGQWKTCVTLSHFLGAVGSRMCATYCLTASLPGGNG